MKNILPLFLAKLTLLMLFLTGCVASRPQTYTLAQNNFSDYNLTSFKRVVVLPFKDLRGDYNRDLSVLALIPLVPYGWAICEIPEQNCPIGRSGLTGNLSENLARNFANGLAKDSLFQEVTFGHRRSQGDMMIQGKILEITARQKLYTYGLSLFGGFPWLIYLPSLSTVVTSAIEINCIDAASNRTIYSSTYTETADKQINAFYDIIFTRDFFKMKKQDPINLESMVKATLDRIEANMLSDLHNAVKFSRQSKPSLPSATSLPGGNLEVP